MRSLFYKNLKRVHHKFSTCRSTLMRLGTVSYLVACIQWPLWMFFLGFYLFLPTLHISQEDVNTYIKLSYAKWVYLTICTQSRYIYVP